MMVMELTSDVRAAILRVLEEFSPTESDGVAAQGSAASAAGGSAVTHPSGAGPANIRHGEHDEAEGRQDQSFPV
jgi:hypothetical protein